MTDFYFIRHGQTTANTMGLKQGIINSKITYLTEIGKQQTQKLHEKFSISFADKIIASPLQRTKDTAKILNQTASLPVQYDKRILEISYGDWDGKKNKDLQIKHPKMFDPVFNDVFPDYANLANGETFNSVINRIKNFMEDIGKQYPDQEIIVITHGFTIKAAVLAAMGKPKQVMPVQEPDNTSVTKITLDNKYNRYYLRYFNRSVETKF